MTLGPDTVFLILVFAAVFSAAQAAVGLLTVARQKRRLNRRLKVAERVEGVAALVMELRKQRGLGASGEKGGRLKRLSDLIVASGLTYDPRRWALVVVLAALVGGVLAAALTRNLLLFPAGALVIGAGGPLFYLKFMAGRRAKALGFQLPQALDIIVRSLEAGHPVPTAVGLVGREMSDPIGSEFGMAADEIAYGATLEQAVERMSERCQHPDVDLNAATVRERHKMRLKIKAASSEGRASAMILTAAPLVAVGFITISSPHFYGDVIHLPVVRWGLAGLGGWMLLGNMVMRRMIDMRI